MRIREKLSVVFVSFLWKDGKMWWGIVEARPKR